MALRPPPYPPDTRAKGWRFELDLERIEKSQTWLRAKRNDVRAAALFLWSMAWQQQPCGTLPGDDEVIDLLLGFPDGFFAEHRAILLRGWYKAADGLLYHPVITDRVLEMVAARQGAKDRQIAHRARMEAERAELAKKLGQTLSPLPPAKPLEKSASPLIGGDAEVTESSRVTNATGTGTGTGTGLRERDNPPAGGLSPTTSATRLNGNSYLPPDCPHTEIVAIWRETLPQLPQPQAWRGQRVEHMRARWRELAVEKHWPNKEAGLAYFRKLFAWVGRSQFLTGRGPSRDNRDPFLVELSWLIRPENFLKVIEGRYHPAKD